MTASPAVWRVWRALEARLGVNGPPTPLGEGELARETSLSRATVSWAIGRLIEQGAVVRGGYWKRKRVLTLRAPAPAKPSGEPRRRRDGRFGRPADDEPEIVARDCLKCREAFTAEGRFIRLCQRCKSGNRLYAPGAAGAGCGGRIGPARRFG